MPDLIISAGSVRPGDRVLIDGRPAYIVAHILKVGSRLTFITGSGLPVDLMSYDRVMIRGR